jgi:erythromycin esterase
MKSVLLLTLMILFWPSSCAAHDGEPAFTEWAKVHAVPLKTVEPDSGFEDLAPLKEIIDDARLVCLGESRHDIHEQFRLKHRFIEFLVEELDFSVLVLEESLPHARSLDAYVLGGDGDPQQILNDLAGWFLWDTREILDLISWLRRHNAKSGTKRKVRIFGADVTAPRLAMGGVLAFLEKVDPDYCADLQKIDLGLDLFEDHFWPSTMERYQALSDDERTQLRDRYDALAKHFEKSRNRYIHKSSEEDFEWAHRQVLSAQAGNTLYSTSSRLEGGQIRDQAMADNLRWILNTAAPGARAILWAHNAHVARTPFTMPDLFEEDLVDMVHHLDKEMGDDLVTIAASFNRGNYSADGIHPPLILDPAGDDFVDGALARTGIPLFILDFRNAPNEGPVADWLSKKRRLRSQHADMYLVPAEAYDAIFFIDRISRSEMTPKAVEKFKSMNQ